MREIMKIRKTTEADFDRVMEIYAHAREFMAKTGNPKQWGPTNWPPEALIHNDIRDGDSYVCTNEEGDVLGTFFFIQGEDIEPTYREITDGAWLDDSAYGAVHRIASDGSERGTGQFCLNWAFEQCGHLSIRRECFVGDFHRLPAVKLCTRFLRYGELGFAYTFTPFV